MTTQVETADPTDSLSSAAVRLQELRVGALPVLEDGKLVGIISSSDFLGIAVMLLDKG
jgi:CBS domain-containing protein